MKGASNGLGSRCLVGLLFAAVMAFGCGGSAADDTGDDGFDPTEPHRFEFGSFTLQPGEESSDLCVSVELHNTEPVFVHAVTLETGGGFHHSNWFYVQHESFRGPDGIWPCAERQFSEPVASLFGGVLFAQSTQAANETQEFPAGAVLPVPPYSKIVAGLHLLNASDAVLTTPLALTITPIARADVTVQLRPLAIEDQALAILPHARTDVQSTCDYSEQHLAQFGRMPDFKLYYVLPHYHALGLGMRLDAIDEDGTERVVFDADQGIGSPLGGPIDPPFPMAGAAKLRMTCKFDNPRDDVVGFGIGDQEMCVLLGFTDSLDQWGGLYNAAPGDPVDIDGTATYQHPCSVFAARKDDL